MTETNELRCMLDEAGVEWHDDGYETTCTVWTANGITWHGLWRDGSIELLAHHLTPEQAIAATVGRGTCEADETETIKCWVKCKDEPNTEHMELIHVMECSECGHTYEHVNGDYEFCPRCGRKRVDE